MTFGQKLKNLRETAGMSQVQLASTSGVPVGTIRDYEQVKRDPLLPTAIKLAKALGVSVEVFAECVSKEESEDKERAPKPRGRPPKAVPSTPPVGGPRATPKRRRK
jgi:transcriptional regulator with XRE-family HTH domain